MAEFERSILMSDLADYMDAKFIDNAFKLSGVEVLGTHFASPDHRGKKQCYVLLPSVNACHSTVRNLNNKIIPHSAPPQQFKLKYGYYGKGGCDKPDADQHRSYRNSGQHTRQSDDLSLFVSNLSDDVSSDSLFSAFVSKYKVVTAKVLNHSDGRSKGCGFVRFHSEYDLHKALVEMQHMTGIGKNPLRVRLAYKQPPNKESTSSYSPSMNPYYPYQNYQNFWVSPSSQTLTTAPRDYESYYQYAYTYPPTADTIPYPYMANDDNTLEDPIVEDDVENVNKEFMERSEEFYNALEESRWQNIEEIVDTSIATNS